MIDKIEAWIADKNVPSTNSVNGILQMASTYGIHGINTHGVWLPNIEAAPVKVNCYLNLDYPFSQNSPEARKVLLHYYLTKYGHVVTGINIAPIGKIIDQERWDLLESDIIGLVGMISDMGKEARLVIDAPFFNSLDELIRVMDVGEQAGANTIIFCCNNKKVYDFDESIYFATKLKEVCSLPVGFFNNINNNDKLTAAVGGGFSPIIMNPQNVFDLLGG